MSATLKPRWGYSLTASSLGPGLPEVTMFGGTAEPWTGSPETQPKVADTTLLQCISLCNSYYKIVSMTLTYTIGQGLSVESSQPRTLVYRKLEHSKGHQVYITLEVSLRTFGHYILLQVEHQLPVRRLQCVGYIILLASEPHTLLN